MTPEVRTTQAHRIGRWPLAVACALAALALTHGAALAVVFMLGQRLPDEPAVASSPAAAVVFYDDTPIMRQARVRTAAARITKNHAIRLIAVGGWRPERGYNGAALMASEARALGVESEKLRHDAQSNDSISNLRSAATLAQDLEGATLELVSDRYHLVRLRLLAKVELPGHPIGLVPAVIELSSGETLRRLHHEVLAYITLLLPRSWTESYLALSRST